MSETRETDYLAGLDERQKTAAVAEHNCVVTAGAGAGKTTVLAARYIHLVMEKKIPIRSIFALTFTKKAAAEMYERIYRELASQTSEWAAEQLDDFQNAHITTLDAFCAEIVRQAAGDFGYSPEFSIDDEKCADLSACTGYRYLLGNREAPGIAEMLMSFPFDEVAARLFGDLGASWVTPLALDRKLFSPMKERLRALAAEKAGAAMDSLRSIAVEIAKFSAAAPKADCMAAIACSAAFIEARGRSSPAPPPLSGTLSLAAFREHFDAFAALTMRSYGRSDAETAIKALAKKARDLARTLLDFSNYEAAFPSHCALLDRLDEFAAEVAEAKRLADIMSFKDLGICAVDILKRRPDIRNFWKSAIESIMIDEFQDNNELQKELLYLLAEKRGRTSEAIPGPADIEAGKLFFVGDEKQSIYRFRGADVAVFKRLSGELSGKSGAADSGDIDLSANYRSSSELIDFFNDFFPSVMDGGTAGGGERGAFEAGYSAMKPGNPGHAERERFDSQIRYYLVEPSEEERRSEGSGIESEDSCEEIEDAGISNPDALSADDSLAFEIARFVAGASRTLELRAGGVQEAGAPARKAGYGDFAVLLRTTTHQHRLEKYLRLFDIPYDAESPRGLFRESPANDIYSILAFALDRGDKAAYAAVLRSPLCRVSDEAFLDLMTSEEEAFKLDKASEYDSAMLARAKAFFADLASRMGSASVSDIVEYVWNQGGLRLDIMSRPEAQPFLEHFDYLFHIAAGIDGQRGRVADFLAKLRPLVLGETDKLEIENVPRNSASGVKILTIHKAKGLQFPIVIVPWVENAGNERRSQELWEMLPEGLAVDIKAWDKPGAKSDNILYRLAKDLEDEMNVAEIKRLLYVACTRAEDHLFFFGKKPKRSDSGGHSFQYYLERYGALEAEKADGAALPAPLLEKISLAHRAADEPRRLRKTIRKPRITDFAEAYTQARSLDRAFPRLYLNATGINHFAFQMKRSASVQDAPAPARPAIKADAAAPAQAAVPATAPSPAAFIADPPPIPPDAFGTLCHDAVEHAVATGSAAGYAAPEDLLRGLDPASAARAAELASTMAANFMTSDFWTSLPPASSSQSEKSFLLTLGEFVVEGRMDLFVETAGEIVIIDFKSDMEQDPTAYYIQMEFYRRAAEGICPGKKVRTGLYWLRSSSLTWLEPVVSDLELLELARASAADLGQEYA